MSKERPARPRTAVSTLSKTKSAGFFQNVQRGQSRGSVRPSTGMLNSFVNFDFLQNINKFSSTGETEPVVKPKMKVKTDQFHSIIYKVKKQKEELDDRINNLERWRSDYSENQLTLMSSSGGFDFVLKMNAQANPYSKSREYLNSQREELENEKQRKATLRSTSSLKFLKPGMESIRTAEIFSNIKTSARTSNEGLPTISSGFYSPHDRRNITQKINDYISNLDNLRGLIDPPTDREQKLSAIGEEDKSPISPVKTESPMRNFSPNETSNKDLLTIDVNITETHTQISEKKTHKPLVSPKGIQQIHARPLTAGSSAISKAPAKGSNKLKLISSGDSFKVSTIPSGEMQLEGRSIQVVTSQSLRDLRIHKNLSNSKSMLSGIIDPNEKSVNVDINASNSNFISPKSSNPMMMESPPQLRPMSAQNHYRPGLQKGLSNTSLRVKSPIQPEIIKHVKREISTQTLEAPQESHVPVNSILVDGNYFDAHTVAVKPDQRPASGKSVVVVNSWISKEKSPISLTTIRSALDRTN
jgi:hypothetical protein